MGYSGGKKVGKEWNKSLSNGHTGVYSRKFLLGRLRLQRLS
jgi:hypothetical protein